MPTTFPKIFGAWLKRARHEIRGYTQEELEEASGVSQSTISQLEKGAVTITSTTIERLLSGLRMTATEMCDQLSTAAHKIEPEERGVVMPGVEPGQVLDLGQSKLVTRTSRSAKGTHQSPQAAPSPENRRRRQQGPRR